MCVTVFCRVFCEGHPQPANTRPICVHSIDSQFLRTFVPEFLAALIPRPRVNLTRFHGVFAPNSQFRAAVTPARRGKGGPLKSIEDSTPEKRHKAMTWAQRLKRVFNIDVSICTKCGGEARIIACIEDQAIIDRILAHLFKKGALLPPSDLLPAARASPSSGWLS